VFSVAGTDGSAGKAGRGPGKGEVALEVSQGRGGGVPNVGTQASKRVVGCGLKHTQ